MPSSYDQGDCHQQLRGLRQPEHIPSPRSSATSLNTAYWQGVTPFTSAKSPDPVSADWKPHLHKVSTPAKTAGPGPALKRAKVGHERQKALSAEERQVQELLAAFLAE